MIRLLRLLPLLPLLFLVSDNSDAQASLSRVGTTQSASGTSVTIPSGHARGDLVVIMAYSLNGSCPTVPFGWTSIACYGPTDDNLGYMTLARRIAASSSETSDSWTNATYMAAVVYRNSTAGSYPTTGSGIAANVNNSFFTTGIRYDAPTMDVVTGTSWVAGFAGVNGGSTQAAVAPSGMTNLTSVNNGSSSVGVHDTGTGVTGFTQATASSGGGRYITAVVEIKESGGTAPPDCSGGICTAASCSTADVAVAYGATNNGQKVFIPAGSCTWTSTAVITKAVTIQCAGPTLTTITYGITSGPLINVTLSTVGHIRISQCGFTPDNNPGQHWQLPDHFIKVNHTSGGKQFLADHNRFYLGTGDVAANAFGLKTNKAVIWQNYIYGTPGGAVGSSNRQNCRMTGAAVRHKWENAVSEGGPSWESDALWGALDTNGDSAVYFENNDVLYVQEGYDLDDHARAVIRYNRVTNATVPVHHGNDTSPTGGRYSEVYGNTYTFDNRLDWPQCDAGQGAGVNVDQNVGGFIAIRGGTSIIHDNTFQDLATHVWDNKPEVAWKMENLRRNGGPYPCYRSAAEGGASVSNPSSLCGGGFCTGGYPVPRQPGWGYISGSNTTKDGATFAIEPIYLWNNSGAGAQNNYNNPENSDFECTTGESCDNTNAPGAPDAGMIATCQARPSALTYIQQNREWILGTKPNYSQYTYPHPLTVESGGTVAPRGRSRWHSPHYKPERPWETPWSFKGDSHLRPTAAVPGAAFSPTTSTDGPVAPAKTR